jgi:hypothetical protein
MNRRITLTMGAAAGGMLASAILPVAIAFADASDTAVFPDAPGVDSFTIGDYTFDPYLGDTVVTDPGTEGFNPVVEGTGTPGYFETGETGQNFEVFSTASGSSTPTELGSISTTENVTSLFGITNTGFDVTGGLTSGSLSALPAGGTIYDVTNFGSGYENIYTDVPGAAGAAGTVTDTFVTPFGDENLSSLVSALDLTSLDPGAAFGVGADAASAAADAAGSIDPLSFLGL